MSLRARLLVGLVALVAIGLAVVGVITYAEQRSFLLQRVDQQAVAAFDSVSFALDQNGVVVPGSADAVRRNTLRRQRERAARNTPPGAPNSPLAGGRLPGPSVSLPPGTYGQRRDARGHVLGHVSFSYGQSAFPAPNLPASIPVSTSAQHRPITVGSAGTNGLHYRVLAMPTHDQPGTTIVAVPLRDVDQTLSQLLEVEALVAGGVLLALAVLAWWVIGLGLRPLDRMGKTADAIAAGDLSRRVSPATARTEVGRLGLALNAMLGQIEAAFAGRQASEDRLRRFVADASHELRTPLVSIRGYAELFRIGAVRDPAGTEKAMRRIEDEAARMGVLVEDLLTLARLDQEPEVGHDRVDLTELATDAADDARAAAPDRSVELRIDGPASVLGNAHQLRQVIANLVRNALVHTPAGTPIELSVGANGEDALVEVRDHGPGLPGDANDAIFERFWRAAPGRERKDGSGLGLAIVAAIVAAHGGRATARNARDGGASFVVRLPLDGRAGTGSDAAAPA